MITRVFYSWAKSTSGFERAMPCSAEEVYRISKPGSI